LEQKFKSLLRIGPVFDETEFNQLFLENYPKVVRVADRMLGNPDEAEDLAVEAFWRLWERPPSHKENLSGWLYRVVTHLAYNMIRSKKRRQNYEERYDQAVDGETVKTPDQTIEEIQEKAAVRWALGELPRRDAQILILRSSGLSYKEIAASLQISFASVGTLLVRAEKKFETLYMQGEQHASK
jgi:RNA polymerase sigma-70 factor (ECF subfamily)